MKRLAIVAAILAIAACKAKESTPADTAVAAPAMSPAPAMMDTTKHDSAMSTTTTTTTTKTDSTMEKVSRKGMKKP